MFLSLPTRTLNVMIFFIIKEEGVRKLMQRLGHRRRLFMIILLALLAVWGIHHLTATSPRLKSAWSKITYTSNNQVGIAVYSSKKHQTYSATNVPDHKYHMASTVKVSILAGLLVKQNGNLTDHQKKLAKQMIEASDNDATNKLFKALGGQAGLQSTFNEFGMSNSSANESWGLSTTTPRDQVKLLNNIFYKSSLLTANSRDYINELMSNVDADQNWGISASSNHYALKNGWLENGREKWIVNSIGCIKNDDGTSYTIAIYSDHNQSMQSGEDVIEQLARVTKSILD